MVTQLWAVAMVVFATIAGAFGPILLKKGAKDFNLNPIKQLRNYNMLGGIAIYAFATLFFIPALKGGELSVLYPIVSLAYIWTTLLAIKFLGEKMNLMKWMGIAIIILGVSLIGLGA